MERPAKSASSWQQYWAVHRERLDIPNDKSRILDLVPRLLGTVRTHGKAHVVLDVGCGEGHLLARILSRTEPTTEAVGCDNSEYALENARGSYPHLRFVKCDYLKDPLDSLPRCHVLLAINTLHEAFSTQVDDRSGRIDVERGHQAVRLALRRIASLLEPQGCLILMDGIEPDEPPDDVVRVRLRDEGARADFERFCADYRAFAVDARIGQHGWVEMSRRSFVRFLTKSIFIRTPAWSIERHESYQYFDRGQFEAAFREAGLTCESFDLLSLSRAEWELQVEAHPALWPHERALIVGRRRL